MSKANERKYASYIAQTEKKYGIPPRLLHELIRQESGFNPYARSGVGATGIAQFMPATARSYKINPNDPFQAIDGAGRYLSSSLRRYKGDIPKALASYNAGVGAVDKYHGVPPYKETRNYVQSIQSKFNKAAYKAGIPQQSKMGFAESASAGALDALTFGNAPQILNKTRHMMDYQASQGGLPSQIGYLGGSISADIGTGLAIGGVGGALGKGIFSALKNIPRLQRIARSLQQAKALQKLGQVIPANRISNYVGQKLPSMIGGGAIEISQFGRGQTQDIQRGLRDKYNFGALGVAGLTGAIGGAIPTFGGSSALSSRLKNAVAGSTANLGSDLVQTQVDPDLRYTLQDALTSGITGGVFGGLQSKVNGARLPEAGASLMRRPTSDLDIPTKDSLAGVPMRPDIEGAFPNMNPQQAYRVGQALDPNFHAQPTALRQIPQTTVKQHRPVTPQNVDQIFPSMNPQQRHKVLSKLDPEYTKQSTGLAIRKPADLSLRTDFGQPPSKLVQAESETGIQLPKQELLGEGTPVRQEPLPQLQGKKAVEALEELGYKGVNRDGDGKPVYNIGGKVGTVKVDPRKSFDDLRAELKTQKNVDIMEVAGRKVSAGKAVVDTQMSPSQVRKDFESRIERATKRPLPDDPTVVNMKDDALVVKRIDDLLSQVSDSERLARVKNNIQATPQYRNSNLKPRIDSQIAKTTKAVKAIESQNLKAPIKEATPSLKKEPVKPEVKEKETPDASPQKDKPADPSSKEKSSDSSESKKTTEKPTKQEDLPESVLKNQEESKKLRGEPKDPITPDRIETDEVRVSLKKIAKADDTYKPLPENPVPLEKTQKHLQTLQENINKPLRVVYGADKAGFTDGKIDLEGTTGTREFHFVPQHIYRTKDGSIAIDGIERVEGSAPKAVTLKLNDFYKEHGLIKKVTKGKPTSKGYGTKKGVDGFSALKEISKADEGISLKDFDAPRYITETKRLKSAESPKIIRNLVGDTLKKLMPDVDAKKLKRVSDTMEVVTSVDIRSVLNARDKLTVDFIRKNPELFESAMSKAEELGLKNKDAVRALDEVYSGKSKDNPLLKDMLGC